MKTFEHDGRTFTVKAPSLALEHLWLQFAVSDDDSFNRSCISDLSKDPDAVNRFMRLILTGNHEGIDWYNDAPAEIFGDVFSDFFTQWSEKTVKALDTLSSGSEPKPSSQSPKGKGKPKKTA